MTVGIDGLVSGLNTTQLIDNLMTVEAAPQTQLKSKQTTETSLISALQAVNTELTALGTAATTASKSDSWNAFTATSSAASVTATTSSTASAGSIEFQINQLATSQVSLVDPATLTGSSSFTITSNGKSTTITPASTSVQDIAAAINSTSGSPLTATAVQTSSGYVLQLASRNTGAANTFTLTDGSGAAVAMTPVKTAQDASITLYPGTSAAQTITNASNTYQNLMSGVNVTLSKVETSPVTVSVATDNTAVTKLAQNLVDALTALQKDISAKTASTTATDANTGTTSVTGGVLSGDSSIRSIEDGLQEAVTYPVNGSSPNDVGISLNQDGSYSFDTTVFANALASDPAKVQSIVSGLASRVATLANANTDSISGMLTTRIKDEQSTLSDLGNQISDWDLRLTMRRQTLQAQFTALETTMADMKSQQSWLTSQLSSLSSGTSTTG